MSLAPYSLPGPLALSRSTVDRAAERRTDDAWLARAWADPTTRVLVVAGGKVPVEPGDTSNRLRLLSPARAGDGERYLLGLDHDGAAVFAVRATTLPDGERGAGLREVGAGLDDREAGLLVHAVALANWHATHQHCARCGAATEVANAGHLRRCPRDGSEHFPRTDPAIIVCVVDDEERALLGRQASWPAGRWSTLAGFVEPGESLEQALVREVHEETGVRVGECWYAGCQPWPFPSSLMVGFWAVAASTAITVDGVELSEARWFSRDELAAALRDGEVVLPPSVSISRRLIEGWYGEELPGTGVWRA